MDIHGKLASRLWQTPPTHRLCLGNIRSQDVFCRGHPMANAASQFLIGIVNAAGAFGRALGVLLLFVLLPIAAVTFVSAVARETHRGHGIAERIAQVQALGEDVRLQFENARPHVAAFAPVSRDDLEANFRKGSEPGSWERTVRNARVGTFTAAYDLKTAGQTLVEKDQLVAESKVEPREEGLPTHGRLVGFHLSRFLDTAPSRESWTSIALYGPSCTQGAVPGSKNCPFAAASGMVPDLRAVSAPTRATDETSIGNLRRLLERLIAGSAAQARCAALDGGEIALPTSTCMAEIVAPTGPILAFVQPVPA
ncbi:MAG: hypothetical protein SNJ79_07810, partial [Sphingomonadaceae bacterium]